jgi:beta-glucanase (GH16 family)
LGRDDWPYDDPFYVIFNLAWGGDWGGSQGVDESALPVTMEVDYIRVFQKK